MIRSSFLNMIVGAGTCLAPLPALAQLFENLRAFGNRLDLGDPAVPGQFREGPKGLCLCDFDGDGKPDLAASNLDGTITVALGTGAGKFADPQHLRVSGKGLRGIVCADLTGDGKPDIAAASPFDGKIHLYINDGTGAFPTAPDRSIESWPGSRNLTAGDFDGDGRMDLAVGGPGVGFRQYRGLGGGDFAVAGEISELAASEEASDDFPKPVYAFRVWREAGATRDSLIMTHAAAGTVWRLRPDDTGVLQIDGSITTTKCHSIVVGAITTANTPGASPDLVTADRDGGLLTVFRHSEVDQPGPFEGGVVQRIRVPGGPRAMELTDLNKDGWLDLVLVLRNFDRIITYRNDNGTFVADSESPVGGSPRELAIADLNGDTYPDMAVINRKSSDVSVLITFPGRAGFSMLDNIYPVDGEIAALKVYDANQDGRDDVILLHKGSWELSVRYAEPDGRLRDPEVFTVGEVPSAVEIVDVNNDSVRDVVTTNIAAPGSISVRLGKSTGGYETEKKYTLPADPAVNFAGALLSIVTGDFNRDGYTDLAAGYRDCRLSFFKGGPNGTFTFTQGHNFVHEPLDMVTADFDDDGDLDIAGVGFEGDIVIVENRTGLVDETTLLRHPYRHERPEVRWSQDIRLVDHNNDGDEDLIAASDSGVMVLTGKPGIAFDQFARNLGGPSIPVTSLATGDFDGDGREDTALSCEILSCVSILTRDAQGRQVPALTVDVPAGRLIASGDLDGDGFTDLVGAGSVLWTALSGARGNEVPPSSITNLIRPSLPKVVINEIIADNFSVPTPTGDGHDGVEIYNSSAQTVNLKQWTLELFRLGEVDPQRYQIPGWEDVNVDPGGRHFVRFTLRNTGFKLPKEGGTLFLINATGEEIDRVEYPAQLTDVSYARFSDGNRAWIYNSIPDLGESNKDNGPLPPRGSAKNVDLPTFGPGRPIRFNVFGEDDGIITSMSVMWRRIDVVDPNYKRVVCYDDGLHEDRKNQDGLYSGLLVPGLPNGAQIEFYLEILDLSGLTSKWPAEPRPLLQGEANPLYTLSIGTGQETPIPLEISEVVTSNRSVFPDGNGGFPDYVEIRNTGTLPIDLTGFRLSEWVFGGEKLFVFSEGTVISPGGYTMVLCDEDVWEGPHFHANFVLNKAGDEVVLTGPADGSPLRVISWARTPRLQPDEAWLRAGVGGPWITGPASPNGPNGEITGFGGFSDPSTYHILLPVPPDLSLHVDTSTDMKNWTRQMINGSSHESVITARWQPRFFHKIVVPVWWTSLR